MRKVVSLLLALLMIVGLISVVSATAYPGAQQRPGDIEVDLGGGSGEYAPGDCNGDGKVNSDDVIRLLWHIMFAEDYELKCSGDFTGEGKVNNEDVIQLLWHVMFPDEYPL